MTDIKIKLVHEEAKVPSLGTEVSAGYDLYAVEDKYIYAGEIVKIPLGFCTELPEDVHARIESRSGMAAKGLVVLTGVIDSDYRGEWMVILQNTNLPSEGPGIDIKAGERIAQMVLRPTIHRNLETVSELSETSRGAGGFGSTGQ